MVLGDLVGSVDRDIEAVELVEWLDGNAQRPSGALRLGRGSHASEWRDLPVGELSQQPGDGSAGPESDAHSRHDQRDGRSRGLAHLVIGGCHHRRIVSRLASCLAMRVCPECGESAGTQPFCGSCGKNLMHVERLPSREEWEARQARKLGETAPRAAAAIPRPVAERPRLVRIALPVAVPLAAIAAVVAIALVGGKSAGLTTRVPVASRSMLPTLPAGSTVRVVIAQRYTPKVGDIVVFHPPAGADPATPVCGKAAEGSGHAGACDQPVPSESPHLTLIRRIVAGPGDTITISAGHVIRNGVREPDSRYTARCGPDPSCSFPAPITIPAGYYFVLGDNRGASDDSRFWGPVPRAYIVGRVSR